MLQQSTEPLVAMQPVLLISRIDFAFIVRRFDQQRVVFGLMRSLLVIVLDRFGHDVIYMLLAEASELL
jgi:hypothetical protein